MNRIETIFGSRPVELVQDAILNTPDGSTVSVSAVIAAAREGAPELDVGDTTLIQLIVEAAPTFGRAVAFDLGE